MCHTPFPKFVISLNVTDECCLHERLQIPVVAHVFRDFIFFMLLGYSTYEVVRTNEVNKIQWNFCDCWTRLFFENKTM